MAELYQTLKMLLNNQLMIKLMKEIHRISHDSKLFDEELKFPKISLDSLETKISSEDNEITILSNLNLIKKIESKYLKLTGKGYQLMTLLDELELFLLTADYKIKWENWDF